MNIQIEIYDLIFHEIFFHFVAIGKIFFEYIGGKFLLFQRQRS